MVEEVHVPEQHVEELQDMNDPDDLEMRSEDGEDPEREREADEEVEQRANGSRKVSARPWNVYFVGKLAYITLNRVQSCQMEMPDTTSL